MEPGSPATSAPAGSAGAAAAGSVAAETRAAAARRAKPAGYRASLLLILAIIVAAEVLSEVLRPVLADGDFSGGRAVLFGVGVTALLGLVVVNGRWLWATLGNLRFALALITMWAVSSVLGTLVVQRFPNQADAGYARNYIQATGDFLYNLSHLGQGVTVHPAPDVEAWFEEQRHVFGEREAAETAKQWYGGEAGRLKQAEIERFIETHREALERSLAVVNALRLPEAFQISVWFKTLLGLLAVALVVVVVQRWRGELRQVGWVMAHFGMVIFLVGASVRALTKVDGFLPMTVGESTDGYFRKVAPERAARGEAGVFLSKNGDALKPTPLDFLFTLHRFKTEYPRHLELAFPNVDAAHGGVRRTFLVEPGWTRDFLDDELSVKVERWTTEAHGGLLSREGSEGPLVPAIELSVGAPWLPAEEQLVLHAGEGPVVPPEADYVLQYVQADSEQALAEAREVYAEPGHMGWLWTRDRRQLGEVGARAGWTLPGDDGRELVLRGFLPDYAHQDAEHASGGMPHDPAIRLEVLRAGVSEGHVWVTADRMEPDAPLDLPVELRFEYDTWMLPAAEHHRLIGTPEGALRLVSFRAGLPVVDVPVALGQDLLFAGRRDRYRPVRAYQRYEPVLGVEAADVAGMTEADIYYASLPTALELSVRGGSVRGFVEGLRATLKNATPPMLSGIVSAEAFDRGEGQLAISKDGYGLRVRLVSDDPYLGGFPASWMVQVPPWRDLPFRLAYFTNERGAPLRFTSDVSLTKDGVLLKRDLVEPNRPLYLAGYQFSQADFRKDDPGYSGFGVVRDPSVRIAYAGMSILVLGVILLFYVFPLIASRRSARSAR